MAALMKSQELHSDPKALGLLVLEALKPHGWENVDPGSIVVEEHSGGSGNMTFRVRATGIDGVEVKPSEVALHSQTAQGANRLVRLIQREAERRKSMPCLSPCWISYMVVFGQL